MASLVLRNNTITGTLYRDDPTILAWELINEPSVPADNTGQILAVRSSWLNPAGIFRYLHVSV